MDALIQGFSPMKRSTPLCAMVLASAFSTNALAECFWEDSKSGHMEFNLRLGTYWIPRDAPVGTVIGTLNQASNLRNEMGINLVCDYQGIPLTVQLQATTPIVSDPVPPVGGEDLTGRILQTGVDGVGIHIRLQEPYMKGISPNFWRPVTWDSIPYQGRAEHSTAPTGIYARRLKAQITLIKTGPIAAGPQAFNGKQLFSGVFSDVGNVLSYNLHGTVMQAQCTLTGNPVSADPVLLGDHDLSSFSGTGFTTAPTPFSITLNDCVTDSGSGVQAYLNFDGVKGSTIIDKDRGLFSLTSSSTAQGIGIQLLHHDGSAVKLQQDVPVAPIATGQTRLDFQARYYQTQAAVKAGSAEGALSFTVSYR
ncbi:MULTISPECIES: fimbrial protein [unclassified Pseudomonas]|uniref:fimbrial protein n=1 Tax=unclassified Pseudomonas TaxID=196821 RepID=UPI001912CD63|nr:MULTISPECIES: fimbrial protein [unclassified Pseudomonas]